MDSFEAFKEKLDKEHEWPTTYMFKFVVPANKAHEVRTIFSKESLQTKQSKNGNYVAFTMKKLMRSSDEVVELYLEAGKIEGVVAL